MPRGVTTTRQASELVPLSGLADVVQAFLGGQPISMIMNVAADGTAILDVLHPSQDIEINITPAQIQALVNAYVKPPDPVDPLDTLADALVSATTPAQLRAAFIAWADGERAVQRRGRNYPKVPHT
jgi:hypothetical protein